MPLVLELRRAATRRRAPGTVAPLALLTLAGALLAAGPAAAWAQSPGDPPHFMGALMRGMVILMVPSFFVCLGITIMAYRRRNRSVEE